MQLLTRRHSLQHLLALSGLGVVPSWGGVEPENTAANGATAIQALAEEFLKKFEAPAISVAFARKGKLVYRNAFGLADPRQNELATIKHRFRIASISKPITSVAIYALIEAGKLKLEDRVFGKGGLLPQFRFSKDRDRLEAITVQHLLTHTSGGWGNQEDDPMFMNPGMDHAELIGWTLRERPLENTPGQAYAYSNFGYCVLGRVIESLTRKPYAEHVLQAIFTRCGIQQMQIAGNTLKDRALDEAFYQGAEGQNPYGMNVRRMDSHGGWLASPTDMLRFLVQVDGFPYTPDILQPATIAAMTTGSTAQTGYASGWSINATPNWWHGGSLPGSSTIAVRTASGMCWAGFTNTRTEGIGPELDRLMWKMARAVPEWQA